MTTIADPATATPVEVDTALMKLDAEHYHLSAALMSTVKHLHSLDGQRAVYRSRNRRGWPKSDDDTITSLRAKRGEAAMPYDRDEISHYLAQFDETVSTLDANRAEFDRLDAEWERRRWQRYIGVLGGHIHSGIRCAGGTIRPTTKLAWAPTLSGKDVADAVAELGPRLCTHCFPEAPVEWQAGEAKPERCAGSGRAEVPGTYRRQGMGGYGRCPECGTGQTVTGRGLIRAHKPAAS